MKPDNTLKSQPIQQQQHLQTQQPSPTHQSYSASTVSSTASGSSSMRKKQISPIIAAAADTAAATAKAAAAISASMAPMSIYDNFNARKSDEDLQGKLPGKTADYGYHFVRLAVKKMLSVKNI